MFWSRNLMPSDKCVISVCTMYCGERYRSDIFIPRLNCVSIMAWREVISFNNGSTINWDFVTSCNLCSRFIYIIWTGEAWKWCQPSKDSLLIIIAFMNRCKNSSEWGFSVLMSDPLVWPSFWLILILPSCSMFYPSISNLSWWWARSCWVCNICNSDIDCVGRNPWANWSWDWWWGWLECNHEACWSNTGQWCYWKWDCWLESWTSRLSSLD